MSLTVYDISDRELLMRLDELADAEGLCTSQELVDGLGIKDGSARLISSRLSWLKRFGALETAETYRESEETGNKYKVKAWRLSPDGETYTFTTFNAAKRRSVEGIDDANLVEAVGLIAARFTAVNATARNMMRRQWASSTGLGRQRR